jgi:predicted RNA-binding Zn ribbon-like protein
MSNDLNASWDLGSGALALDFANTAEWHASKQPQEWLQRYDNLLSWSLAAGLLTRRTAMDLRRKASSHLAQANAALKRAIELREIIYRIFACIAHDQSPSTDDLASLNRAWAEAMGRVKVVPAEGGFQWRWEGEESLEQMLWPITRSATDLLTSSDLKKVGQCADDRGCGWLFIDTSRNQTRRWCSMESCGNRAKARRYYKRQSSKSVN